MSEAAPATGEDAFLGGRLRLRQPLRGHRAGHDAVLLAAATPARDGGRLVEFGAGVGAAGLAVAARGATLRLDLVERDAGACALARDNVALNSGRLRDSTIRVVELDVTASAHAFDAAGLAPDSADGVMMNPPFNDALRHRPSPDAARRAAHEAEPHTLDAWTHAARRILRPGGALTLIWRAEGLREVLAAIDKGFGGVGVVNVHPRPDAPAIRVLVRAVKGSRAPLALHPPLMLETRAGVLSDEAAAILTARDILPLARD